MPNIVPIMKLKDTGFISKYVSESDEPVFVTKNGYGCMVMMNIEVFDRLVGKEVYLKEDSKEKPVSYIAEKETKYNK